MNAQAFRYRVFISYNHADERWASWLHARLERYRVPAQIAGTPGAHGPVPRRIGRCFRDQAELSAATHLSEILQQALRDSECLVVVCSPQSAASRWVNEEIAYYRALGRGERIYALVVSGEPHARDPALECFPSNLLRDERNSPLQEPLAADARSGRDSRSDAFLKIASAILGVSFDALRRREQHRRNRLAAVAVAASLVIAGVTTALAVTAYQARNEATYRRAQADDLIAFMLGDLKGQLERVGRLDTLDATVGKAANYLSAADAATMDADSLAQRVMAISAIADIRYARGDVKAGMRYGQEAIDLARTLRQRRPGEQGDELFAQAVHSYAEPALDSDDFETPAPLLDEASALLAQLPDGGSAAEERLLLKAAVDDSKAYIAANGPKPDFARAIELGDATLRMLRQASATMPDSPAVATAIVRCEVQRLADLYHAGRFDEAMAQAKQIVAESGPARQRFPRDQPLLHMLQAGLANAVRLFSRRGALDDAAEASRESLSLGRSLLAYEPDYAEGATEFAHGLTGDGELRLRLGDWRGAEQDKNEGLAVLDRWIHAPDAPESLRSQAMGLHQLAADITLASHGPSANALAEIDAGLAVGQGAGRSTDMQVKNELPLDWRRWYVTRTVRPDLAAASRATTLKLIADLQGKVAAERLQFAQAAAAYLDGDMARGDALFQTLRARAEPLLYELANLRKSVCAGRSCPALAAAS